MSRPKVPPDVRESVAEDAVWLEHLEEEMEAMCRAEEASDKNLCLKNSPEDLATYESLKRVRAAVRKSDDVALPESGLYYDQLHSKIMAAIETAEIEPRVSLRASFAWSSVFRAAGVSMMVAIIAWVGLQQRPGTSNVASDSSFERHVASVDSRGATAFAHDMGSFESEEDFVTEAAEARLAQSSRHDVEAMLNSLKM